MNKTNKKGNIPTIMLPFAMLILIGVALFTFNAFSFSLNERANFAGLVSGVNFAEAYIENVIADSVEQTIASTNPDNFIDIFREEFKANADEKDLRLNLGGNFFGKARNGEFSVEQAGENYTLIINDVFVKSSVGKSEMTKRFDILAEFNSDGLISVRFINKGRLS